MSLIDEQIKEQKVKVVKKEQKLLKSLLKLKELEEAAATTYKNDAK